MRIHAQFEARAVSYDNDDSYHPPLAARLLQLCGPDVLRPGAALLDVAAGTGLVGLGAAAACGPGGRVVLVDVSAAMLDVARAKHAAAQRAAASAPPEVAAQHPPEHAAVSEVHFLVGDMEDLTACLPARWVGSFDAITCSSAVPFLRRPRETLAGWRAWLARPHGVLAFNAFAPPALEDFSTFRCGGDATRAARGACARRMQGRVRGCVSVPRSEGRIESPQLPLLPPPHAVAATAAHRREVWAQTGAPLLPDPCEALGSVAAITDALTAAGYVHKRIEEEAKTRWLPAASAESYAAGIWDMALHRNPFLDPSVAAAALPGSALEGCKQAFVDAVTARLEAQGRFDAAGGRMRSSCTVLHARAVAGPKVAVVSVAAVKPL
jgi:SAM-dependent methyltransferase